MLRSIVGPAVPQSRRAAGASDEALLSAPRRNSATSLANNAAGPRGAREAVCGAGCHATPQAQEIGLLRMQRSQSRTNRDRPRCVAGSDVRGGRRDCGQSKPSLNSNCRKTRRKQFRFVAGSAAHCMRSCRQRLPRVRSIAGLGNGEFRAKTGIICACASTADCKPAWILEIDALVLLKSGASRQEKESRCNGNGALTEEHSRHNLCDDFFILVNAVRIQREPDMNPM
jgi:hypothetical protein